MVNNIPVNGWPQLKDLEAVQPTLDRLDKIEAWKRTVKEETFTGDDITIENALALPARSLITEIEPIQDLRGYDKPWTGGAYKNKIDANNISVPATDNTTVNIAEVTLAAGTYTLSWTLSKDVTATRNRPLYTVSGSNVYSNADSVNSGRDSWTFTLSDAATITLKWWYNEVSEACMLSDFQLEAGGTATSFAPYSNICPISGRNRVAVDDTGRNIWDEQWEVGMISSVNGQNEEGSSTIRSQNYIPVTPSTNYYIRCSQGAVILLYASDKSYITYQNLNNGGAFTTPQNAKYIRFRTYIAYGTTYHNDICINISDASFNGQYVPYKGRNTATIQLGQTVYGADINWDTGAMTVDRVLADNSLLTVFRNNTAGTGTLATFNKTTNGYASKNAYTTSIFKPQTVSQWEVLDADTILTDSVTGYCIICTDVPNQTQEQLQQWLIDNGAQICLYLATPTTIQLTPEQLQMLKGYNRVTLSDGYGTIELKALTGANWS